MNQELDNISEQDLNDDETLMQYLRGELSAEDEAAFLQKIQQNPDLKSRAIAVARLIKGIETKGVADDEKLKSAVKKLSEKDVKKVAKKSGKKAGVWQILTWAAAAAAVVVLVVGMRIYYVNSANERLAAEYENSFQISDVLRGGDGDLDAKMQNWREDVVQGRNLDLTIEKLSGIFTQSQSENYNICTNYFAASGWYLALAHLKNHDPENAKNVLKMLVEKSGDNPALAQKAAEVLERIK